MRRRETRSPRTAAKHAHLFCTQNEMSLRSVGLRAAKHSAQPIVRHGAARAVFRDVDTISSGRRKRTFRVQGSHVMCGAASLWAICKVRAQRRKKLNVSCSIRDSSRLFDLALDARGFRLAFGRAPLLARHTVLERSTHETFLHLLADAHANLEPAYSE